MASRTLLIPAAEAAGRLGVRVQTLYSYVSRGLVRTKPHAGDPRARLYMAADIDALAARRQRARRPSTAAATALDWGLPVLETSLSSIADGHLCFRNVDAVTFAATASLEETAALLWGVSVTDFPQGRALPIAKAARATDRAIARLALLLPDEGPGLAGGIAIARASALVRRLAEAAAGAPLPDGPMHVALAGAWKKPGTADTIRRALVLSADHELNASSFAVRVVASTGASMANCMIAGLAALSGPIHGGASERVAMFLEEVTRAASPASAVAARLARGESIPGFGHVLYAQGDPRAIALLAAAGGAANSQPLCRAVEEATGLRPNIDFALAALERGLGLPRGAALALFAIGRSVGWIAHAFEQQSTGQLIRPRARYVG